MKTITEFNFEKNFTANAEIRDLLKLGWMFDIEDTMQALNLTEENAWNYICETYHVEIKVDEEGETFWRFVNTQKSNKGINEGSDNEPTGDNEQTIADLKQLHDENNIWNENNIN